MQEYFSKTSNPSYSSFIYTSRYARWLPEESRREYWPETVDRYLDYFEDRMKRYNNYSLDAETKGDLREHILHLDVMPSMRALMTAGPALEKDNMSGFNCSFISLEGESSSITVEHEDLDEPVLISMSKPIDFDEIMYVLMCGTGAGFSCERQFVAKLPKIGKKLNRRIYTRNNSNYPNVDREELSYYDRPTNTIHVSDSKYGWASSLRILIVELYNGNFDVTWDTSQVREAGARLETFGGRASGPEPLLSLFDFTKAMFKGALGRKLTSIEAHDLVCKIAAIVVVGGVRRSALISLSNLSDERMRQAKSGAWWVDESQRALANNSACYTEKPDIGIFMQEWQSLYASKSGERGIFNREASQKKAAENGRRDPTYAFGTNPCSEIILRSCETCNLSEVVVRGDDTVADLERKVRLATILGTFQATLTDYKYLSNRWKVNNEEEALLGVSMTGIMDNSITNGGDNGELGGDYLAKVLLNLKRVAVDTNKEWADRLGINQAAAITCVKPSGTVSQLVDSASGIHARHNPYYIRTVRGDKKDPLTQFMVASGFPVEDDAMNPGATSVFSFPVKAPDNAICRQDQTALEQLDFWLTYQRYWCEHKPSITVSVKEDEWLEVGAWVYKYFDECSGVSFLPFSEHTYVQAPYQDCSKEEFEAFSAKMPIVDWSDLSNFEKVDTTKGSKELACSAGVCEIVDI
jgi:ribonucleoside-triphosphate reductase